MIHIEVGPGTILDLFAGPGGWDQGLRAAGYTGPLLGIEWDADACATARAAGHPRLQADVSLIDPSALVDKVPAVIASPPCQGFSAAGKGEGLRDTQSLLAALDGIHTLSDIRRVLGELSAVVRDSRSLLVLQPLRYVLALTPKWTAWEQVPAVQPIWDRCAAVLRRLGYSVDTGILNAEQYGVPQTRKRAVLVAHRGDMPAALLPAPTHSRYHTHTPERLDVGVAPWVTMGEALGWGSGVFRVRSNYGSGGDPKRRGQRLDSQPASTMTSKADRNKVISLAALDGGRCLTLDEAAMLQTFPAGYPWAGKAGAQFRQVGDAVPPLLAAAILAPILAAASNSVPAELPAAA